MKRPNILFLMTDEQKWDTLPPVNDVIHTPAIKSLLEESVYFENAYCPNPSCVPSRAAIVTGKYPTACQCPTFITKLPAEETTFMTRLRRSGYHTAVVGKQHFAHSEIDRGYDEELIVDGHFAKEGNKEIKPYMDYLAQNNVDINALWDDNLICGSTWKADIKWHVDWFVGEEGKKWLGNHLAKTKQAQDPKPWFFTLSFPGPHQPYNCEGTDYAQPYDLEDMNRPDSVIEDIDGKPELYQKLQARAYIDQYPEELFRKTKRAYYATLSLIDEKIGEVIQMLKDAGEYENTLIVYTADHGDFMGDFGMITKAQYLAEGLMRVPLFVKPPVANFKGCTVQERVCNINLAATCLHAAGAEHEIVQHMENNPWNAYWDAGTPDVPPYLYLAAADLKGVIEDDIKTVYYIDRPYGELYDLKNDPLERVNLWEHPDYQVAKTKAMGRIIAKLHSFSPKSEIPWNTNAPKI